MSMKKRAKKLLKKAWKYTKRFCTWLWEWVKFIFTCGRCGRKRQAEQAAVKFTNFDYDITPEGSTPRCEDGRIDIDKIYAEFPPSVREALKRQNELQNRMPPLVPVQRTASAPAEIQSRAANEPKILEEKRESNDNA